MMSENESNIKGAKIGVVESDARDKSRKVVIHYKTKHPKYGKYVSKRTILQVHDENNESHNGDIVEVAQCKPISKSKSWKLTRIVEKRSL
tara:strand:+ start:195013 stop:195282 length:270 start_codon:yes stop_codon:yes gene_type:complete